MIDATRLRPGQLPTFALMCATRKRVAERGGEYWGVGQLLLGKDKGTLIWSFASALPDRAAAVRLVRAIVADDPDTMACIAKVSPEDSAVWQLSGWISLADAERLGAATMTAATFDKEAA